MANFDIHLLSRFFRIVIYIAFYISFTYLFITSLFTHSYNLAIPTKLMHSFTQFLLFCMCYKESILCMQQFRRDFVGGVYFQHFRNFWLCMCSSLAFSLHYSKARPVIWMLLCRHHRCVTDNWVTKV